MHPFQKSGFGARISSRITMVIRVAAYDYWQDQPGSILTRDRGASTRARCEVRLSTGRGHRTVEQKLASGLRFANPTKSIGTAAFTWVHEHFRRPAFEHTRRETKPEGKKNGRPIAPACITIRHGSGDGFQRDYTSRRAAPFGKKHTSTRGRPATQQGRWRSRAVKGRRRDETTAHTAGSTTFKMSNVHHFAAAGPRRRDPDAPPVHGETKSAKGARQASQDRERGHRTVPQREREISKTRVGQRVAGPLGPFLARRAEGHRPTEARGKWPLHRFHAALRGKPLP
ncbi:hypothetical protein H6P81_021320 [Aristolochia fimbriata]|uniref:Uncharacterized protein n=1 Tax=Aristolochia fimbriata TaxID=158543 RepID=A0AAV7DQ69_ARIFI|nr:hypothetical protein H6P81_021320 [Aristolochia fimbriata]